MDRTDLKSIIVGLGSYGERLCATSLPVGTEVVPAADCADSDTLRLMVKRAADVLGTQDLRVAGSLWQKQYNATVMMGVLAAMTLTGIGLDASLSNAEIIFRDGMPRSLRLRDLNGSVSYAPRVQGAQIWVRHPPKAVESTYDLQVFVLTALLKNHLCLVLESLQRVTGLSPAIVWGNSANLCADIYDRLGEKNLGLLSIAEDRRALLDSPQLPGLLGQSPWYNRVRYVPLCDPGLCEMVRVRRSCCLRYRLPHVKTCYTCPRLANVDRVELIKQLGVLTK